MIEHWKKVLDILNVEIEAPKVFAGVADVYFHTQDNSKISNLCKLIIRCWQFVFFCYSNTMHYTSRFHRLQLLAKEQNCVLEKDRRFPKLGSVIHGAAYALYSNRNFVTGHFDTLDEVYAALLSDKSFNWQPTKNLIKYSHGQEQSTSNSDQSSNLVCAHAPPQLFSLNTSNE